MKLTTVACLLALATAAKATTEVKATTEAKAVQATKAQAQQDDSQGDDSQGATQSQDEESYGNDGFVQSYGGHVGMYMKAPEVCLGNCPAEAPCQHPGGGCMPKACSAPVQYAAQNYGETQQSGY